MILSLALLAAPVALAEAPSSPADDTARILSDLELHQTVTLVSPGAEPRQVVRFAPKPGATASYDLVTHQDMDLTMKGPDGQVMDLGAMTGGLSPTMIMSMTHEVGQPAADGQIPVRITTTDVGVEDVPAEMKGPMLEGMSMLEGLGYRMWVSPQGVVSQVDVSIDDPMLYEATQSMADQFISQSPSFPTEPVGVGASWTVTSDMSMAGLELATTQTLTVVSMSPERIELATSFTMARGDAALSLPGLPPGAAVDISRFDGSGSGTLTTDLTTMASSGSMAFELDLGMQMAESDSPAMDMAMHLKQTTEMRPKR